MPVYEYRCKKCGATFERLVLSGVWDDEIICPSCGSKDVEKLLSSFASRDSAKGRSASSCSPSSRFT